MTLFDVSKLYILKYIEGPIFKVQPAYFKHQVFMGGGSIKKIKIFFYISKQKISALSW
jgi:hypothetical protein